MKNLITIFLVVLPIAQILGQTEPPSVYGNLTTKKFYNVSTGRSGKGANTIYKVDEVKVEKAVYDKYHAAWEEFGNCCPCILLTYDKNDLLLTEAVHCTDCYVGYYKEFYPNGKLKLHGHYRENPTKEWNDIFKNGYCNVEDGEWIYYDEAGQIIRIETWKDGDFVTQKPIGKTPEVWRAEKWVNDELWKGGSINLNNLGAFEIILRYKSELRFNSLNVDLSVSPIGGKKVKQYEFPLEDFGIDKLTEIAKDFENAEPKILSLKASIYGDGELIQTINLTLNTNP